MLEDGLWGGGVFCESADAPDQLFLDLGVFRTLISRERLDVVKAFDHAGFDVMDHIWVDKGEAQDWFGRWEGFGSELFYDIRIYLALGQMALHGWSQQECFGALAPGSHSRDSILHKIAPASGLCMHSDEPGPAGSCLVHGPEEHMKCLITDALKLAEFTAVPGLTIWPGRHERRERATPAWLEFGQALIAREVSADYALSFCADVLEPSLVAARRCIEVGESEHEGPLLPMLERTVFTDEQMSRASCALTRLFVDAVVEGLDIHLSDQLGSFRDGRHDLAEHLEE